MPKRSAGREATRGPGSGPALRPANALREPRQPVLDILNPPGLPFRDPIQSRGRERQTMALTIATRGPYCQPCCQPKMLQGGDFRPIRRKSAPIGNPKKPDIGWAFRQFRDALPAESCGDSHWPDFEYHVDNPPSGAQGHRRVVARRRPDEVERPRNARSRRVPRTSRR